MSHYVLTYELVHDYLDRRPAFRDEHLGLARAAHDRGDLVLAGALANPADRAILVFTSAAAAEAFAESDPYVRGGLVTRREVREWTVVIGADA